MSITIEDLADGAELHRISTFEVSATFDESALVALQKQYGENLPPELARPDVRTETAVRFQDDMAQYRCRIEYEAPFCRFVVDSAISYRLPASVDDVAEALLFEFGDRVAIMTLYPYIRQHMSDMTLRVGDRDVPLGILRPGNITFGPDDDEKNDETSLQD